MSHKSTSQRPLQNTVFLRNYSHFQRPVTRYILKEANCGYILALGIHIAHVPSFMAAVLLDVSCRTRLFACVRGRFYTCLIFAARRIQIILNLPCFRHYKIKRGFMGRLFIVLFPFVAGIWRGAFGPCGWRQWRALL